ncbi:hypothetical protein [Pseudoduganella sp. RAF53_2]|uniref:hypothetical protein n=1 Tax=unclassified Pseudoduganella TaxID=2637179 RepID=UPI003F9C0344
MTEEERIARNQNRLLELFPWFSSRLQFVIADLENAKFRPRIQDAWRSPEDQLKAYNSGHSQLRYGFHNVTGADGSKEALAVDLLDDDFPLSSRSTYLIRLAAAAEKHGLMTGIRFGLQTAKMIQAVDQAILTEQWDAPIKIGWDPTHVQPVGLSPEQARMGKRPS